MAETQITLDDFITPRQVMRTYGGVAFINVCGVLAGDMPGIWEKLGNTDYRTLTAELVAAKADASVRSVILYVRSPGGNCAGCTEIAICRHREITARVDRGAQVVALAGDGGKTSGRSAEFTREATDIAKRRVALVGKDSDLTG